MINAFFFALTFLTRLPSPVPVIYSDELPSKSMVFYPVIGTIIGLILIFLDYFFSLIFASTISNILLLISLVYLTGGLHLDGFIDTVDGIFSGRERDRMLVIMQDSLIGSFGAIAIVLLLLLKYNLFKELSGSVRFPLLLLMPSISRYLVLIVVYKYPLAASSKLGRGFNYYLTKKEIISASIYLTVLCFLVSFIFSLNLYIEVFIVLFTYLIVILISNYVNKKLTGLTGDIYGAIIEISEVVILLAFFIITRITIS
jgi:adenosylcobinamide-GDP ribazoletransferase